MKRIFIFLLTLPLVVACAGEARTLEVPLPQSNGLFATTSNQAKLASIRLILPSSTAGYLVPADIQQALEWLNAGLPSNFLDATKRGYRFAPQLWSPYRMTVLDQLDVTIDSVWQLRSENSAVCNAIRNAGFPQPVDCGHILLMCLRDYSKDESCNLQLLANDEYRLNNELTPPSTSPNGCESDQAQPFTEVEGVFFGKYSHVYTTGSCDNGFWIYLSGKGWLQPTELKDCIVTTRNVSTHLVSELKSICKFEPEGLDDFYKVD